MSTCLKEMNKSTRTDYCFQIHLSKSRIYMNRTKRQNISFTSCSSGFVLYECGTLTVNAKPSRVRYQKGRHAPQMAEPCLQALKRSVKEHMDQAISIQCATEDQLLGTSSRNNQRHISSPEQRGRRGREDVKTRHLIFTQRM